MALLGVRDDFAHFDALGCHGSSGSRLDLCDEGLGRRLGVEQVRGLLCGSAPPRLGAARSGVPLNIVNAASADSSMVWPRRVSCVKGISHKFVSFGIYVVLSSWPVADLRVEG